METCNSHFDPANNVTPSSSLVTQNITKYINHIRKSFHNKYQIRLRKVREKKKNKSMYEYSKYIDMSLWNNIEIVLLQST